MSIESLIIDPGDMSEGSLEFAGAQARVATGGSGCEAIDDSPRPEVLSLLAEGCRTKFSRCEIVAPGVVGGILISYLH